MEIASTRALMPQTRQNGNAFGRIAAMRPRLECGHPDFRRPGAHPPRDAVKPVECDDMIAHVSSNKRSEGRTCK